MIDHRKIIVTCSVMTASLMQALDTTIANVALPHIQGNLSASQEEINWVLTSYIMAASIATLPIGWFSGKFGSRTIFSWSIVGFTIASILCGLSSSIVEIVLFRLLQGIFGAALIPLSQATLLAINPKEKHASAMALWGLGVMVGPIIGPSLGGYLTENYSWRWIFYINLPFGILAYLGISNFSENYRKATFSFDFLGFTFFALFISSLQLFLDRGSQLDWLSSSEIRIYLITFLSCFWMFCCHILWKKNALISIEIFRDQNFAISSILMFLVGIILLSTVALLPPMMQNLFNYPISTIGLVMVPRGIGTILSILVVGRLLEKKYDFRIFLFIGLLTTFFSLWELSNINLSITNMTIIKTGLIQGIGLGLIFIPLNSVAFLTLTPDLRVEATGIFTLIRNIGSAIGISLVASVVTHYTQVNHAIINQYVNIFNINSFNFLGQGKYFLLNQKITQESNMIAYLNSFRLMAIIVLFSMFLLLFIKKPQTSLKSDNLVSFE